LPPPISKFDESLVCDQDIPAFLDLDANTLFRNKQHHHPLVHTLPLDAPNNWKLTEDRPGKAGWIDEYSEDYSRKSPMKSIIFQIPPNRQDELFGLDRDIVVQVKYLRTYRNAGAVAIYVCGNRRVVESIPANDLGEEGLLDAYWYTKVSIVEIYALKMNDQRCTDNIGTPDDTMKTLGINSSYIMFSHVYKDINNEFDSNVRTFQQKFKIAGIKICAAPPRSPPPESELES
jgi:hypothetical protein